MYVEKEFFFLRKGNMKRGKNAFKNDKHLMKFFILMSFSLSFSFILNFCCGIKTQKLKMRKEK